MRRGLDLLGAPLDDLVQLAQVVDVALEVGLARALGGGADDHAALALVDVLEQLALALALRVGEAPAGADPAALRHVDEVAAGDRELHREPRALRLQRVLDDLDQDLLARLDQLVDSPPLAAAAARRRPRRPGGRSRRRAGSRFAPGRCRRTRPPCRGGRCRRPPCRCCRRSSAGRGARRRARRPSNRQSRNARRPRLRLRTLRGCRLTCRRHGDHYHRRRLRRRCPCSPAPRRGSRRRRLKPVFVFSKTHLKSLGRDPLSGADPPCSWR